MEGNQSINTTESNYNSSLQDSSWIASQIQRFGDLVICRGFTRSMAARLPLDNFRGTLHNSSTCLLAFSTHMMPLCHDAIIIHLHTCTALYSNCRLPIFHFTFVMLDSSKSYLKVEFQANDPLMIYTTSSAKQSSKQSVSRVTYRRVKYRVANTTLTRNNFERIVHLKGNYFRID